jgi:hypothetical protein
MTGEPVEPTTDLEPPAGGDRLPLKPLFSPALRPGELRLGWEYRASAPLVPYTARPPVPYLPWPKWLPQVEGRVGRARSSRNQLMGWGIAIAVLSVAIIAAAGNPGVSVFFLAVAVGGVAMALYGRTLPDKARQDLEAAHAEWLEACMQAHDRFQAENTAWVDAKAAHDRREDERVDSAPEWGLLPAPDSSGRVDVYGGTSAGWKSLVTTAGAAMLAEGRQLTVVDLSEGSVAAELVELAAMSGFRTSVVRLPEQLDEVDLLGGLAPAEVVDVLLEAFHGGAEQVSDETRGLDGRILAAVCDSLEGPITLARVSAGLRVLLDQEDRGAGPLSRAEFDRLTDLFGSAFREAAQSRMVALEAGLHELRSAGQAAAERTQPLVGGQVDLGVVALSERASTLLSDRLAHLLPQLLIRATRQRAGGQGESVVILTGADRIRRRHLEKLDELSRLRGVRLIYMFKHLREDAADLLGATGSAIFMRLGNATEARNAAEFIGKEHIFTLSQVTASSGETITDSADSSRGYDVGTSQSRHRNWALGLVLGHSPTEGVGSSASSSVRWNETSGSSRAATSDTSSAYQRSYDFAVEPRTLQSLPESAFLFVQLQGHHGDQLVKLGDCNPAILSLPRVSPKPLERG